VSFTLAELEGVPEDVISGYTKRKEGEKEVYYVNFKEPDIVPIVSFFSSHTHHLFHYLSYGHQFKYAVHSETRRRAWEASDSRLEINAPLVPKIFGLRRKMAKIMGYDTWADYITEVKMVKSAHNALDVRLYHSACDLSVLIFPVSGRLRGQAPSSGPQRARNITLSQTSRIQGEGPSI
jgi:Zn-dependent oligopeptidase